MLEQLIEDLYGKKSFITFTSKGIVTERYEILKISSEYWYSRVYKDAGVIYKMSPTDQLAIGTKLTVDLNLSNIEESNITITDVYHKDYSDDVVKLIKMLECLGPNVSLRIRSISERTIELFVSRDDFIKSITLDYKSFVKMVVPINHEQFQPYVGLEFTYNVVFMDVPVKCFAVELLY